MKKLIHKDVMEVIPTKPFHMPPRTVLLQKPHIHTLVKMEHVELQEVPIKHQEFKELEQQQEHSKQPSRLIQFQFALMQPTGRNIQAEYSATVLQTSIMQY